MLLEQATPKTTIPGQVNFWQNTPAFMVSLLKGFMAMPPRKKTSGASIICRSGTKSTTFSARST
jgi:hypothetical protein